jgi:glycosyltransferase involved in cell wall biosynthesis
LRLASRRRPDTKLVAVDMVLRQPRGWKDAATQPAKRFLLGRVDHFIHYFRDVSGYDRVFGIDAARSSFVPFKTNLLEGRLLEPHADGEYVLCFGRSLRDFDTFFAAVEQLPYPAAVSRQDPAVLRAHGARFTRSWDNLPQQVRVVEDHGKDEDQVRIIGAAKLVVLPILKTSLVASGISSCLNAMSLGKCVIGTEGPGMSDVFRNGEVIVVPAEDPAALAGVIRTAWEDDALRLRTAQAGHRYAVAQGGEQELYQRIIDRVVELYG